MRSKFTCKDCGVIRCEVRGSCVDDELAEPKRGKRRGR